MILPIKWREYVIRELDRPTAARFLDLILELYQSIPKVSYEDDSVLAERKDSRIFYGKWQHSLTAFHGNQLVGILIGYEREAQDDEAYPCNTIYISEFAVRADHRKHGLGRVLLSSFLEYNEAIGFLTLDGITNFTVQTNRAPFNQHVVDLYESFNFRPVAHISYENRSDIVMRRPSMRSNLDHTTPRQTGSPNSEPPS